MSKIDELYKSTGESAIKHINTDIIKYILEISKELKEEDYDKVLELIQEGKFKPKDDNISDDLMEDIKKKINNFIKELANIISKKSSSNNFMNFEHLKPGFDDMGQGILLTLLIFGLVCSIVIGIFTKDAMLTGFFVIQFILFYNAFGCVANDGKCVGFGWIGLIIVCVMWVIAAYLAIVGKQVTFKNITDITNMKKVKGGGSCNKKRKRND